MELEFYNPGNEVVGKAKFYLNKGKISAFQLDLNGKYRDGSIEENGKLTQQHCGKRMILLLFRWTIIIIASPSSTPFRQNQEKLP